MLVAAAVVPCPPLLVPEVAAGAAAELDGLRVTSRDAVSVLAAARPDRFVVLGPTEAADRGRYPSGAVGSLRAFGVDFAVALGAADERGTHDRPLPTSLTVAAWLLNRAGWAGAAPQGLGVDVAAAGEQCEALGQELAASAPRVALLVAGDGSACRSVKAPGYLDERAGGFDAGVAAALAAADTAALLSLDARLAAELKASGRAAWQVLAGAAQGAGLTGELLYDDAPHGVGYFVAAWS